MGDRYDHWSDALKYGAAAFVPADPKPMTATQMRIQQAVAEKEIRRQAEALGVAMDKSIIDAMSGVTDAMTGTTTKVNVGSNPFFASNSINPMNLLAARLRIPSKQGIETCYWFEPLDYVHIVFDETTAFVMIVAHGKASVLTDDTKNFPTDELVAQFRVLLASQ